LELIACEGLVNIDPAQSAEPSVYGMMTEPWFVV
jgi:hypothetical protein